MTAYRVPARPGSALLEVRRSRFLATVVRAATEDEARAVVATARREHREARHHCSAFVLGPRGETARSSDDGEPPGTAGAPMLEALRGAEVSDVVAVVTRWFGGVLLGAGGLVRAYGDVVRAALAEAGVRERRLLAVWAVTVAHGAAGRLENDLRARGVTVRAVAYGSAATLTVAAPPALGLAEVVAGLTGGAAVTEPAGTAWFDAGDPP